MITNVITGNCDSLYERRHDVERRQRQSKSAKNGWKTKTYFKKECILAQEQTKLERTYTKVVKLVMLMMNNDKIDCLIKLQPKNFAYCQATKIVLL